MAELDTSPAKVIIAFHSSSTKDGREAYTVTVLEGATEEEAERVMAIAQKLRQEAIDALSPKIAVDEMNYWDSVKRMVEAKSGIRLPPDSTME